jgi:hypothetical protein
LKDKLKRRGVEDLFETISKGVEKYKNKLIAKIQKVVSEEVSWQKEIHKCLRSLLIKNVEKLIVDIGGSFGSLVHPVTKFMNNFLKWAIFYC